jgi:cytochrome c oxidase cbb3-type subunit 3
VSDRRAQNRVLGHADEADGIEEYDNPLPDWWLGMFVGTVIWAGVYAVHYHFIAHRSPVKELAAEMADARKRWPESEAPALVVLSPAAISAGEAIYKANCTVCHGENLEGKIGPSFLDSTWIHGGKPEEIVHTITVGVPAKGMLTWGPILGTTKIGEVAAYVISRNHQALGIHDDEPEHEEKAK